MNIHTSLYLGNDCPRDYSNIPLIELWERVTGPCKLPKIRKNHIAINTTWLSK